MSLSVPSLTVSRYHGEFPTCLVHHSGAGEPDELETAKWLELAAIWFRCKRMLFRAPLWEGSAETRNQLDDAAVSPATAGLVDAIFPRVSVFTDSAYTCK